MQVAQGNNPLPWCRFRHRVPGPQVAPPPYPSMSLHTSVPPYPQGWSTPSTLGVTEVTRQRGRGGSDAMNGTRPQDKSNGPARTQDEASISPTGAGWWDYFRATTSLLLEVVLSRGCVLFGRGPCGNRGFHPLAHPTGCTLTEKHISRYVRLLCQPCEFLHVMRSVP